MKCTLSSASEYIWGSGEVAGGKEYTERFNCRPAHTGSVYPVSLFFFCLAKQSKKDLDPSYKMDLDILDCLGRVKLVL